MFNITAAPTVLETVAYVAYLVPVLAAFLWPARRPTPAAADRAESSPPGSTTSSTSSPEAPEHVRA
jgi:high-affinity iron transporter